MEISKLVIMSSENEIRHCNKRLKKIRDLFFKNQWWYLSISSHASGGWLVSASLKVRQRRYRYEKPFSLRMRNSCSRAATWNSRALLQREPWAWLVGTGGSSVPWAGRGGWADTESPLKTNISLCFGMETFLTASPTSKPVLPCFSGLHNAI